jgi:hypothetical protein
MMNVIMVSVVMLISVILCVNFFIVILSVVMMNVVRASVVAPSWRARATFLAYLQFTKKLLKCDCGTFSLTFHEIHAGKCQQVDLYTISVFEMVLLFNEGKSAICFCHQGPIL